MSIRFGMIGGGVMGEAILSRLLAQKMYSPETVLVSDPSPQRRAELAQRYQVEVTDNNRKLMQETSEVLLLAVKPQVLPRIEADWDSAREQLKYLPLLISILAGIPILRLKAGLDPLSVVRVMPNTNATVGASMSAIAPGSGLKPEQLTLAKTILGAIGEVVEVPESVMDAVTGISGSGPAYVALLIESLADGGVASGLPRQVALQLAIQTVLGTATLLQQEQLHPAQLKDRVTSPGGTTIAGVAELEAAGFRSAVIKAVQAATARSKELGRSAPLP